VENSNHNLLQLVERDLAARAVKSLVVRRRFMRGDITWAFSDRGARTDRRVSKSSAGQESTSFGDAPCLGYTDGCRLTLIKMPIVIHHLPITKARVNLGELVRRVNRNKEYFILEKDGIPVAGIMGANELEDYLELQDPKIRDRIQKSNADYLAGRSRPAKDFLAELRPEAHPKPARKRPRPA
jgi:hypothetical protein